MYPPLLVRLLALLPRLSLALLTVGCPAAASELVVQAGQLRALGIEVQRVAATPALQGSPLPARVTVPSAQLRVVAAPLGGLVESLLAAPGDRVRRGQPLARLSSREVLELQRDALQADSQAALLRQNLTRDEQLFAEGLIAASRLQATRAAAAQAAALAGERRRGLQLAGNDGASGLSPSLTLNSPIDGVVLEQMVGSGQRIEAASAVYRIAALSPLWLEIQAPLAAAAQLRPGQHLRLLDSPLSARLIAVGRAVDPLSQSVLVRGEIREGAEQLIPGQLLSVELPATEPGEHWRLPAAAVVRDGEKALVFVRHGTPAANGEQRFAAQPVGIVAQGGDSITVSGLRGEQAVVVRGASALKAMRAGVGRE
ncbi:efflux RND transporter periplasmic adaptor subunit [Dechloromonas sp. ZY10]|uniref:efflux RND transporter periplasmic adaptor subunit n=1 Tax=Dechloromonas aquae TaxID=2664436 RepID=UPI003527A0C3